MKATVTDISIVYREIEVPDKCPKCQADVTELPEGGILRYGAFTCKSCSEPLAQGGGLELAELGNALDNKKAPDWEENWREGVLRGETILGYHVWLSRRLASVREDEEVPETLPEGG